MHIDWQIQHVDANVTRFIDRFQSQEMVSGKSESAFQR